MKHIKKKQPPRDLIAWTHAKAKDAEGQKMNWGYDDMPATIRQQTKDSLIREQGGLCCYSGRRIRSETSHIEHLKPQDECVNHEDTDYRNLLAAYPSADAKVELPYGAHKKKNWYVPLMFIHPLRSDCEKRYIYRDDGRILPARANDKSAIETIVHLGLDNPELKRLRSNAIHVALFEDELSKGEVRRLQKAMDNLNAKGEYPEYCFVIKQACERYLKRF
jgi:uncharacterized protein (TIGR02646 family)